MYVNVHVLGPPQVGFALGVPAETVSVLPQLSVTAGGVGAGVLAAQATVEEPPAGIVTIGGLIVYV